MSSNPSVLQGKLAKLVDQGLTFGDCVAAFATNRATSKVVQTAHDRYAEPSNGSIEIDPETVVSEADEGVWVMAWVWVPKEDIDEIA